MPTGEPGVAALMTSHDVRIVGLLVALYPRVLAACTASVGRVPLHLKDVEAVLLQLQGGAQLQ